MRVPFIPVMLGRDDTRGEEGVEVVEEEEEEGEGEEMEVMTR